MHMRLLQQGQHGAGGSCVVAFKRAQGIVPQVPELQDLRGGRELSAVGVEGLVASQRHTLERFPPHTICNASAGQGVSTRSR